MSKFHFDMEPVLLIYFYSWDITPRFSPKVTHLVSNPLSIRKTNKQNKQKPCLKKNSYCCYGYSQHSKQFSHPRRCLWWGHRAGEGLTKPTLLHVLTLSSFHTSIHPGDNESHSRYSALSLGICVPKPSLGTDWASLGIAGYNEMKGTQP